MPERYGNLLKIIGIVTTLLVVGTGAVIAFTNIAHQGDDNADDIKAMLPEVEKNKEHRIKFEEKVNTMAISIEAIRKVVEK